MSKRVLRVGAMIFSRRFEVDDCRVLFVDVCEHDQPQSPFVQFKEDGAAMTIGAAKVAVPFWEDRDGRTVGGDTNFQ